jgi:hypothetical protein
LRRDVTARLRLTYCPAIAAGAGVLQAARPRRTRSERRLLRERSGPQVPADRPGWPTGTPARRRASGLSSSPDILLVTRWQPRAGSGRCDGQQLEGWKAERARSAGADPGPAANSHGIGAYRGGRKDSVPAICPTHYRRCKHRRSKISISSAHVLHRSYTPASCGAG